MNAEMVWLPADASDRRFMRLRYKDRSRIIIDASHEKQKIAAYVQIAKLLREHGFSTPIIYNVDEELGFVVVEDLGTYTLGKHWTFDREGRYGLYEAVIGMLPALQRVPQSSYVYEYTEQVLLDELLIFVQWFCIHPGLITVEQGNDFLEQWGVVLRRVIALEGGCCFVHKDFHLDNLTWLSGRQGVGRIGILDFQDAKYGSATYDLVSILNDPRYEIEDKVRWQLMQLYASISPTMNDKFDAIYPVYVVQRCLKILGNIYYLANVKGKTKYLAMERNLRHSIARHVGDASLKGVFEVLDGQIDLFHPGAGYSPGR